jgi:hypothetical protein
VIGLLVLSGFVLTAEPAHFVWPKPELVDEIEIPDVVQADGVPVRMHSFRSKLGVQQLLQLYADAFDRAGFYQAAVQQRVTAEPHLTALDWRSRISYSAIFSPDADGTTHCLLGEAALGKKQPAAADFAPLMPGAIKVARIDQETDRLISFSVQASAEAVREFYAKALTGLGFTANTDEAGLFVRGPEQLRVVSRPRPNGVTSVVLLHKR